MTDVDQSAAATERGSGLGTARNEVVVVVLAMLLAAATWVVWTAAGVQLAARTGDAVREVSAGSVVVAAIVVAGMGNLLARLFGAGRSVRGLRRWTVVASSVWVISFLGTLGATSPAAGLGLASLHLVVGATVIIGVHQVHRAR